jgi:hypothetical protein
VWPRGLHRVELKTGANPEPRVHHGVAGWESARLVMPFNIEIAPGKDAKGAPVHTVTVTIDDHETVLTFFESKEDAEQFAEVERARLMGLKESGKNA